MLLQEIGEIHASTVATIIAAPSGLAKRKQGPTPAQHPIADDANRNNGRQLPEPVTLEMLLQRCFLWKKQFRLVRNRVFAD
jgi:hypothetical protein